MLFTSLSIKNSKVFSIDEWFFSSLLCLFILTSVSNLAFFEIELCLELWMCFSAQIAATSMIQRKDDVFGDVFGLHPAVCVVFVEIARVLYSSDRILDGFLNPWITDPFLIAMMKMMKLYFHHHRHQFMLHMEQTRIKDLLRVCLPSRIQTLTLHSLWMRNQLYDRKCTLNKNHVIVGVTWQAISMLSLKKKKSIELAYLFFCYQFPLYPWFVRRLTMLK